MKKYLIKLVQDEIKSLENYIKSNKEYIEKSSRPQLDNSFILRNIERLGGKKNKAEKYLQRLEEMEF